MEPQWDKLARDLMLFDLQSDHYTVSVVLDKGGFFHNYVAARPVRHCHGHFEVRFLWNTKTQSSEGFVITPPGVWHTGSMGAPDGPLCVTTFSVYFSEVKPPERTAHDNCGTLLEAFPLLTEEIVLADTFAGAALMQAIRRELSREDICYEHIHALFHLLMVRMARQLPMKPPSVPKKACTSENPRPEQIEMFFYRYYREPSCCRKQLAQQLHVSERQLGRILELVYRKSFRQILLEHRMEFAEGWRTTDGLTAAEVALKVGYTSVRGFCNAYEKYHGKKYKEETGGK